MTLPPYLTGVSNEYTMAAASGEMYGQLGLLIGPATGGTPRAKANYLPHIPRYRYWAADNGCFSNCGAFDEPEWLRMLDRAVNTIEGAHETCLFAVAPDVFDPAAKRGDWRATIDRSLPVFPRIRELGIPAALVFQDGLEDNPQEVPWDEFDVAFIGGSDLFKLGHPTKLVQGNPHYRLTNGRASARSRRWARLFYQCLAYDKPIHVGRVNSKIRLCFAIEAGADSVDGTFIAFGGQKNLKRIRNWYHELRTNNVIPGAVSKVS